MDNRAVVKGKSERRERGVTVSNNIHTDEIDEIDRFSQGRGEGTG